MEIPRGTSRRNAGLYRVPYAQGPKAEDHTLYASHTVWETHAHFVAWTKSEQFRAAHARAGESKVQYLSGPHFEGFDVIIHEDRSGKRSASEAA